jgi:pimeloyl-ACP methyl ester carboxylesterase
MTDQVKLYFECHGQGDPIIILHGLLGSSSNWSATSAMLGKRLQVFTLDLRNHGNSPHTSEFDYPSMAEDLKSFMDTQGLRQATILGHSLGGKIAMVFADRYPEMIDKMIIVDIAPKAYPVDHKALIEAMLDVDLNIYNKVKEVVAALATAIPSIQVRNFLAKNLRKQDSSFSWKVNLRAIRDNLDRLSERISLRNSFDKPVLFIRGDLSDYILEEDKASLCRIYPRAEIATIEGAGHWVHIDAKNSFVDKVWNFTFCGSCRPWCNDCGR